MPQQNGIQELKVALQKSWAGLNLTAVFEERVEPVSQNDDHIHFTFDYDEEEQVDQLIRTARRTLARFGPEYCLPESHRRAAQFQQDEHIQFKVRKSLIVSHLYWGVTFMLCGPEEKYSLVEDTQP